MGTKQNPGRFDCYKAAAPDEPMFVLLARDRSAPTVVETWASLYESRPDHKPEKLREARECAKRMREWLKVRGGR
jgi:hypothetical protein